MIQVETTDEAVLVTIPRDEVDEKDIERWLAWLKRASFSKTSAMTVQEADAMADEMKAKWWSENKKRFLPGHLL